jgi:hypothetical protein
MAASNSSNIQNLCNDAEKAINEIRNFADAIGRDSSPENEKWLLSVMNSPQINIERLEEYLAVLKVYYKK